MAQRLTRHQIGGFCRVAEIDHFIEIDHFGEIDRVVEEVAESDYANVVAIVHRWLMTI